MEMAELLTNIISNFGFPIACCIFMAWYQVKKIDVFTDTMNKNTETMNKHNDILERILDKLGEDVED